MSRRSDTDFLMDMIIACEKIVRYTENLSYEEFCKNDMIVDAVIRNIEILGEAAKNVSMDFRKRYPEVEWHEISKTRDKIIHFYFGVDLSIIWDIVTVDVPVLKVKLEKIVEEKESRGKSV
ncbi:MAG TPA: DUF86 domain-containing protein [Thermotogales bacterium]|nr:DUF86 domain-containing protein [Thermotogales bacterium]